MCSGVFMYFCWPGPGPAASVTRSFAFVGLRKQTIIMGLSNIPNLGEGVLPILVMNTVLSVAVLKNVLRSVLEAVGVASSYSPIVEEESDECPESSRGRRISITQYKSLWHSGWGMVECCVCLCGFEANQEVSELPCKHFFHKACLDKWFDNKHTTCPLCRSID